ncbi:MAG TPA: hypothetical protein VEJ36_01130 [Nitrososphaerales archaeon]|nr:hypothetical protein [Nitrososphaerales archaeon]
MSREEVRKELLKAALERRKVTYGYLMNKFGFTRGGRAEESVVSILGEIDRDEERKGGPGFAAIVVRKDTGFPGGGFFCWKDVPEGIRRPNEKSQNPKLSQDEKDYVMSQQERIWRYYQGGNRSVERQQRL